MEILQLKEFTTLIETLSFSDTSYRLNVSDSALSRHIQALEKELGEKLFDRTTRNITVTEYGKEFLPYALRILKEYEDGKSAISALKVSHTGSFRLGSYYSIDEYAINEYVKGFMEQNKNYRPIILFGNMGELENGFKHKEFNVYTSVNNPEIKDFHFLKVGECVIKAVISEQSPLKDYSQISLQDLQNVPLFLPGIDSPFCKTILNAFHDASIQTNVSYYGRFEDSIEFIKNRSSVALFHFRADEIPTIPGLIIKDLVPEISFDYGISYRDNLNEGEQAFVEYMRQISLSRMSLFQSNL